MSQSSFIHQLNQSPSEKIQSLIERGAVFFVNHSGGKDISTTI